MNRKNNWAKAEIRKSYTELERSIEEQSAQILNLNKELNCLYELSNIIETPNITLDQLFQNTVTILPFAWRYPDLTCARISFKGQEFKTPNFEETPWKQSTALVINEKRVGEVEVTYLEGNPEIAEELFQEEEEKSLINLVSKRLGRASERLEAKEEIKIIDQIAGIFLTIPDEEMYGEVLQVVLEALKSKYGVFGYIDENGTLIEPSMTRDIWEECNIIGKTFIFPKETWGDSIWARALRSKTTLLSNEPSTRIPEGHIPIQRTIAMPLIHHEEVIGLLQIANKETNYDEYDIQLLETIGNYIASVLNARLQRDRQEKAREKAERELQKAHTELERKVEQRTGELQKRNKELNCLYELSRISETPNITVNQLIERTVEILPFAWQYPDIACARIIYRDQKFITQNFWESPWKITSPILRDKEEIGAIEVFYLEERPEITEGPFQIEEKNLIQAISELLGHILERIETKERLNHINFLLRTIRNINQLITKESDRQNLIQGACNGITEHPAYPYAWIALLDDYQKVTTTAESGFQENFLLLLEKLRQDDLPPCTQEALNQSSIVLTKDVSFCADCPLSNLFGDKAALSVCLKYLGKIYGVITISTELNYAQDEEDQALFKELADDIAFALYKIELEEEKKRSEVILQKMNAYNRSLIETSLDPLVTIGEDGKITDVNRATELITGRERDSLIGTDFSDYFTDAQKAQSGYKEVFETGSVHDFELEVRHINGHITPVMYNASLFKDKDGNVKGIFAAARDITKQKQAENALEQTLHNLERSNSELQQFAYVASHDLQEPLRMVASYVQLLERRYKDKLDEDAKEFIAYAVDGATRMKQLINDLLQFSRIETRGNPFELTDMEDVLNQSLRNLQIRIAENGALVTHDPLPHIIADSMQMVQLMQNLIDNAVKFHGDKPPEVHIGVEQDKDDWIFSVRDNGIGIESQYFNRLFIIFQRLHARDEYPGTGIGLAICKRIVARHGGRIWVESQVGDGSTFYFTIPIKQRGELNENAR